MNRALRDIVGAMNPQPHEKLKSLPGQAWEMVRLRLSRGIGPRYYLKAGLNHVDREATDVFGHINEEEYRRLIHRVNPPEQRRPLDSKVEQKRRLTAAGIPTPTAIYGGERGRASAAALGDALVPHTGEIVAAKPASGFGGEGFRLLKVSARDDQVELASVGSPPLSPAELIAAMGGGLIVEALVLQHPWYANLNSSSVNTWRVWVMKPAHGGPAEVVLAYLRMGRAGSAVDNMSGGGLYAPLRPDGRLDAGADGTIFRRQFKVHPDSGAPLENAQPPFVAEALALAGSALDAIADLTFAGMDIAVTDDGPVVIEINAEPDRMGAARVGLPFKHWLAQRGIAA